MQMHEAVRTIFKAVITDKTTIVDNDDLERSIDDAFVAHGLTDDDYVTEYKGFALDMLRYFISIREGHKPESPTTLSVAFGNGQIIVQPDDVLMRPDGSRTLRRIQTGHLPSTESNDVGTAAFILAAAQAFPNADVEIVYLSDQDFKNPHAVIQKIGESTRKTRWFPPRHSSRTLPCDLVRNTPAQAARLFSSAAPPQPAP